MFLEVNDLNGQSWLIDAPHIVYLYQETGNDLAALELWDQPYDEATRRLMLASEEAARLRYQLLYPDHRQMWNGRFLHIDAFTFNTAHILRAARDGQDGLIHMTGGNILHTTPEQFAALRNRLLQPWHIPAKPDGLLPELPRPQATVATQLRDELLKGHPVSQVIRDIVSPFG